MTVLYFIKLGDSFFQKFTYKETSLPDEIAIDKKIGFQGSTNFTDAKFYLDFKEALKDANEITKFTNNEIVVRKVVMEQDSDNCCYIPTRYPALKPCPFCGGNASLSNYEAENYTEYTEIIKCDDCPATLELSCLLEEQIESTRYETINKWNQRSEKK